MVTTNLSNDRRSLPVMLTTIDKCLNEIEGLSKDLRDYCNGLTLERERKGRRIGQLLLKCEALISPALTEVGVEDLYYAKVQIIVARFGRLCGYEDAGNVSIGSDPSTFMSSSHERLFELA